MPDPPVSFQSAQPAREVYRAVFTKAADGMRGSGAFTDPEQWRYDWEQSYTRDEWLDQMPTSGARTQLTPNKLTAVLEGTGAAIDAIGGSFMMAYATVAVTAARLAR